MNRFVTPRYAAPALIVGTGYAGSALARSLQQSGISVITVDIDPERGSRVCDIRVQQDVCRLAGQIPCPGTVFVCTSTRGGSDQDYAALYKQGAEHLASAFPTSRLVFCSSTAIYGITDGRWVTEEHNIYPRTAKHKQLLLAEHTVLNAGGIVLRLGAIYGPNRCELARRFYQHNQAIPGSHDRWLNYIHRDDVVAALQHICLWHEDIPSGVYNLTDGLPLQMSTIYRYLASLSGKPVPHELPATQRHGYSNQKVSNARFLSLGWEPFYPSFIDGVHHVLEA